MRKYVCFLVAAMCLGIFASCAKEDAPETSLQPSADVEESTGSDQKERSEVGIPEELKFCDETLYYGMSTEEIREIFGQEDETDNGLYLSTPGLEQIGTYDYYIYYLECMGKQAEISFRFFTYNGLVMDISYGLERIDIKWLDVPEEERTSFMNKELRAIIENLYGTPDSEEEEGLFSSYFQLKWEAHTDQSQIIIEETPKDLSSLDIYCPNITFQDYYAEYWEVFALSDEERMYHESGKQGLTLDNLNRLKEGMSYSQAEVLMGTDSEITERLTSGGSTYLTVVWEDEEKGAYLELKLCDGLISSIYSKGIK